MLVVWLIQAVSLLPAPAPPPVALDAAYLDSLRQAAAREESTIEQAELQALRPAGLTGRATLAHFLRAGDGRSRRLAAVLASGTTDPALGRALIRAACEAPGTSTAVACLLAPASPPPGTLPALARLAQTADRPLAVRAAAAARLLDAGCHGVWPWVRALFAGGTRLDRAAPAWADWPRGTRWELPKRIALLALNHWLEACGQAPALYEPNAAWEAQAKQIEATDARVAAARASAPPPPPESYADALVRRAALLRLVAQAVDGDNAARVALGWLLPRAEAVLSELTRTGTAEEQRLARAVLQGVSR